MSESLSPAPGSFFNSLQRGFWGWYNHLPPRGKRFFAVSAVSLVFLLFVFGVSLPILDQNRKVEHSFYATLSNFEKLIDILREVSVYQLRTDQPPAVAPLNKLLPSLETAMKDSGTILPESVLKAGSLIFNSEIYSVAYMKFNKISPTQLEDLFKLFERDGARASGTVVLVPVGIDLSRKPDGKELQGTLTILGVEKNCEK